MTEPTRSPISQQLLVGVTALLLTIISFLAAGVFFISQQSPVPPATLEGQLPQVEELEQPE